MFEYLQSRIIFLKLTGCPNPTGCLRILPAHSFARARRRPAGRITHGACSKGWLALRCSLGSRLTSMRTSPSHRPHATITITMIIGSRLPSAQRAWWRVRWWCSWCRTDSDEHSRTSIIFVVCAPGHDGGSCQCSQFAFVSLPFFCDC